MHVEFEFPPGAYVRITLCGVNYRGRIIRCTVTRTGAHLYDVQYVDDRGEFRRDEFTPDELALEKT